MIKNNIKALLIHIVVSILSLIFSMLFQNSSAKWASEEAANQHHLSMLGVSFLVIIVSLFLYYHFSKKFLSNQLSIIKNILSFSIIGVIGIVLWLNAFCIGLADGTQILLNSELWQLYSLYYGYCMSLVYEITATNPYIMIVFGILPIIVMYLGVKKSSITETKTISG